MDTTCLANGQRQTATLNCEISTMREMKPRTNPQKASRQLMEQEHVSRPENLQTL
jgi:hypothetical protein